MGVLPLMTDLQKYKKNEKNKGKMAKHRISIVKSLIANIVCDEKCRLQIVAKGR